MAERIRLQKFIAQCGLASRRGAEEIIAAGRVAVNGNGISEFGVKIDPAADVVTVDGKRISVETPGLLIFHKPDNVITTRSDTHDRQTVTDCLPEEFASYFPVGRLDRNTTGLLIMTNDGDLADLLLHPRYEIPRTYVSKVTGSMTDAAVEKAAAGVRLEDGTVSAVMKILSRKATSTIVEVTLHVGKKRVVRRMLKALGHPVITLTRTHHGPFSLGDLKYGEYRVFSAEEYQRFLKKVTRQVAGRAK